VLGCWSRIAYHAAETDFRENRQEPRTQRITLHSVGIQSVEELAAYRGRVRSHKGGLDNLNAAAGRVEAAGGKRAGQN
jgi:hypothetical protein